ncbi:unnamed protein product [Caenorhabditis brenneri]
MILTLFILSALLYIQASAYKCPDGVDLINPPSDLETPTFYPDTWSEGQPIPSLDSNQDCFTTVNVPSGYYANVIFYRDFPTESGSYVTYPNNRPTRIVNNDSYPFYFPSPQFDVNFQNPKNITDFSYKFAFKIQWGKIPPVPKRLINIDRGNPPVAIVPNSDLTVFIANPNSRISLMAFSLVNSSQTPLLRQSAIYGGDSFDSEYIGTLDQVLASKFTLTAYKNRLSVYTFGLKNHFNYPLFMGQDTQDTRGYILYTGANCADHVNCVVLLDGSFGSSLTVTDSEHLEHVKGFNSFSSTAVINVYESHVANTSFIASLTPDNYFRQLPLKVGGIMKFYELKGHGSCEMIIQRSPFF